MKALAVLWSVAFVCFRGWRVAGMFATGAALPICFGVSESLALLVTVYALCFGRVDRSPWGLLVPVLHMTAVLFDFSQPSGPMWALGLYLSFCPLQWLLRLRMGLRCTVGVPVWVSLLDGWPYSVIRHPLAALEMLLCTLAAIWGGGAYNYLILTVHLACCVGCVLIEEKFLRNVPTYASYCERVQWRCCPGVW